MIRQLTTRYIWLVFFLSAGSFAAAPVAVDDARPLLVNGRITINVIANDFDADGDTVNVLSVSTPDNGTATLNTDGSVLYIAPADFTGTATFTYVLGDNSIEGGTSIGTVTINIRNNLFTSFATRGNASRLADVLNRICAELQSIGDAQASVSQRALRNRCISLQTLGDENPDALRAALDQLAPEESLAQMRTAMDSNRTQTKAVTQRLQQQKIARNSQSQRNTFALNGRQWSPQKHGSGASADEPEIWSKLGIFANVQLEESEREITELENGYESSGNGITFGADYFINNSLLIGTSYGQLHNELEYLGNDGDLDIASSTLTAFAAYFLDQFSFYVQAGQSWMEFDSQRNINYAVSGSSTQVNSSTKGVQTLLNSRAEWDWQKNAWRFSPFVRADYIGSEIEGYGEQGGGGLAMELSEQSSSQITISTGIQGSYTLTPNWGVLIPTMSLTYLSETQSDRDPVTVRFASDPNADRNFVLINDGGDSNFYQFSLGASAQFKHGLSGFAEYVQTLSYDYLSAYQLQFGVRYEL